MRADGSGEAVRLTQSDAVHVPGGVSPDGKYIVFVEVGPQSGYDIWKLPIEGADTDRPVAGKPQPLVKTGFNEGDPDISPDGQWVAYTSTEAGDLEVFVQSIAGTGRKWRVSSGGGRLPAWSEAGKELFYRGSKGIMAVNYSSAGEELVIGKPYSWAERSGIRAFRMSADAKRAAIMAAVESPDSSPGVVFVLGFLDDLSRRVR
jgi:Tol biopolymer transport system component